MIETAEGPLPQNATCEVSRSTTRDIERAVFVVGLQTLLKTELAVDSQPARPVASTAGKWWCPGPAISPAKEKAASHKG